MIDPKLISDQSPLGDNIRTCTWATDFDHTSPIPGKPQVSCVFDLFASTAAVVPDSPCLGWRQDAESPYSWWSYSQTLSYVDHCRRALCDLGLEKGDRVGFYARNCPQWTMLQYACLSGGFIVVPIYDTLGPNVIEYVCNHAEVKLVFVSPSNFDKFNIPYSAGRLSTVRNVVIIGEKDLVSAPEMDSCTTQPAITSVIDFEAKGSQATKNDMHPRPAVSLDDVLVIMYTSGTTGNPKGVVLTHRNIVASVASGYAFFKKWHFTFDGDTYLSYLPLSHIYEQQAQALFLATKSKIGFFSGDIKLLVSDLEALQPTIFSGVPRVYARFQQRIGDSVEASSFIKKRLFNWGYVRQLRAEQNPGEIARMGFWDSLVFNKVRGKLLPKVRVAVTGSAPMSAETNDFLKVCLNCPVIQGYGLTETVGGMTCTIPGFQKSGHVGGPLPGVHVKLTDLPEMGYLSTDKPCPRGEICVKGDFVFKSYYKSEEATAEAFDSDGFFRTGDVGQWLEDGSLQIIDRAKNLFKLSQGEYVSPDTLELEYAKAKLVGQIFVYGNSLESTLVAVVVPDVPAATAWGDVNGVSGLESVAASPEFKAELLKQLEEKRMEYKFKKYESITDLIIEVSELNELGQGFTVDNDLMTPSFKLKRPQLKAKYVERLDALYKSQ